MGTKKDSTIYDVAIYCRLSKEDLKENGDRDESASIGTQKAILTDYVRQRGWHLVQTYVDDGYSVIRQIIWSRFRQFIWMCSQVQIAYWSG